MKCFNCCDGDGIDPNFSEEEINAIFEGFIFMANLNNAMPEIIADYLDIPTFKLKQLIKVVEGYMEYACSNA